MNTIFNVIWHYATQSWVVTSELTKARGKTAARQTQVVNTSGHISSTFCYTLAASAVLMATSPVFASQASGADAANVISSVRGACFYDNASQSVVCGDATTTVKRIYEGKNAKSVALGVTAKTTGESNVALGANSSASHQSGLAIGANTQAHNNQTIAIGEGAKSLGAVDISIGKSAGAFIIDASNVIESKSSGNNIAIGESTLANSTGNRNNMVAIGTNAGSGGNATHSVAIGTDAGKNMVSTNNVALGYKSVAGTVGGAASAMGYEASATHLQSTAIGYSADATATYTTALGANAQATQGYALALGGANTTQQAATASNAFSIAVGYNSKSSGRNAAALGVNSNAKGLGSTALGSGANTTAGTAGASTQATGAIAISATTDNDATQITTASGNKSIAVGVEATASAENAIAQGTSSKATAGNAIALGRTTQALGANSIAQGVNAKVDTNGTNAIAIGVRANNNTGETTGNSSIALGVDTNAAGNKAVAIGANAKVQADTTTPADLQQQVGETNAQNGIAIGSDAKTSGTNALAIGQASGAKGQNATAVGNDSHADGRSSLALGDGSDATKNSATAVGAYAQATGEAALALGLSSNSSASRSIAIGADAKSEQDSNIAIGNSAKAQTGTATVAIGKNAEVTDNANSAVALGNEAKAKVANGVALGFNSLANIAAGEVGVDPLSVVVNRANSVWTATHAAVSVGNGTAITRQITSVAAGTNDTDAVNVAQLKAAGFKLATTNTGGGEVDTFTDDKIQNGETLTVDAGKNIKLTHTEGKVSIATKDDVDFDSVTSNDITVNAGGSLVLGSDVMVEMGDNVVTGVADGEVSANSSDAINGSQLRNTAGDIATIIGGNAAVDSQGNVTASDIGGTGKASIHDAIQSVNAKAGVKTAVTAGDGVAVDESVDSSTGKPTYKVSAKTDGTTVQIVNGAISAKTTTLTTGTDGKAKAGDTTSLVTASQVASAINSAGLSFSGDVAQGTTNKFTRTNQQETKIVGGVTDKDKLTDDNIGVVSNGTDTLTVKLAKDLANLTSVTTVGADGAKTVQTANGITITPATSATNTAVVSLNATGLNNGGNKIVGVEDGNIASGSKEAVNGGQLFDVKTTAENKLGTFTVGADNAGTQAGITVNNANTRFDVVGKDKITTAVEGNKITVDLTADAKTSLGKADSAVQAIKVKASGADVTTLTQTNDTLDITQGNNITVANDNGKVKVSLNSDVTGLNSLTSTTVTAGTGANQVVLGNDGVKVGGNTYISDAGLNANSKNITNVADGAVTATSKDAINGSQLRNTAGDIATIIGGNAAVDSQGNVTASDIGGTGKASIHDAIQSVNAKAGVKTVVSAGNGVEVSNIGTAEAPNYQVSAKTDNTTVQIVGGQIAAKTTNLTTDADGKAEAGDSTSLVTGGQVASAINNAGLSFSGDVAQDTANKFARTNQQETKIVGGVTDKTKLTDNNIGVVSNGTDTLTVKLAKDVDLGNSGSLKAGNTSLNNEGVKVGDVTLTDNGLTAGDVSVTKGGINAGNKVINGVAAGDISPTSTQAVNGAQIFALTGGNNNTNVGNYTVTNPDGTTTTYQNVVLDEHNKPALVTYNVSGQSQYVTNSVVSAIKNMNEQGIKFFHTNDGVTTPTAQDRNSVDSSASGQFATAVGYKAAASGENAIAFGNGAQATAKNSLAIGTGNVVSGEGSGAIGDPNIVSGKASYVLGNNNEVATDKTFVIGNEVKQTLANSVILGDSAAATAIHTTATGGNYTYGGENDANVAGVKDTVGVVSVGKAGQTRQIQNVGAGVVAANSTDAINGSQLYYTNKAIDKLGDTLNKYNLNLRAGIAGANAAAGLPQVYLPGKSMLAASAGTYKGETALAVGYSRSSDNGKVVLKLQGNTNSRGEVGGSVGIGYQW